MPLMLKQRSSQSRSSCSEFSMSDKSGATAGKTVESISFIDTPTFEKSINGSARPETRINAASIRVRQVSRISYMNRGAFNIPNITSGL